MKDHMKDHMNETASPSAESPTISDSTSGTVATTEQARDPIDFLMNAGSDGGLWLLLGGPFLLLVVIGVLCALLVYFKRRKENRDFIKDVEEAEDPKVIPMPSLGRSATPLDSDTLDGSPVKPYKVPQELETEPLSLVKPLQKEDLEVIELKRESPTSLRERLRRGLTRTREAFQTNLKRIFSGTALNPEVLEQLHETLYRADFGASTVDQLVDHVKTTARGEGLTWDAVALALRQKTQELLLATQQKPLNQAAPGQPWVILVVGVNGVGKTTTIGKLAAHFLAVHKKVILVAADTFRAAAIEQLSVWGERLGVEVIKHQSGSDPAAVAYDGVKAGLSRGADVVLIDTAGRLHAKTGLMAELGKINRILGRDLPGAPHETWLVVDATTGQNAVQQVKAFQEVTPISGLVVTKLDGTAKGGVIVGISAQFKIPIRYIGVGEKAADLRVFDAAEFAEGLF